MPSNPEIVSSRVKFLIGIVAVGLAGCSGLSERHGETDPPTMDDIRNATVVGLFDDPVTLHDGSWEGEPYVVGGATRPTAGIIYKISVAGDLDGDCAAETVAFLWSATGGSGTRNNLAVFAQSRAGVSNRSTVLIGDRVKPRDARIVAGRLEVDVLEHGPDDAMCCPSVEATRVWRFDGRDLREESGR